MKIAFDAKRAFRNYSGLGNYSRTVISLLSDYYPDNEYILYTPKLGYSNEGFPPANSRVVVPEKAFHRKFHSYWRSFYLTKLIAEEKPEIFHGLSHELPHNIELSNVKTVVTIHDLIFMRFPEYYKPFDRRVYKKKWQYSVDKADRIIAISEQTKKDICHYLKADESKIEVLYQPCNPIFTNIPDVEKNALIKSTYKLPDHYILYVGTIEKRKNLLELLKAMHEGKINFPLVIVGNEKRDYAKSVHNFIHEKNMKNIHFLRNIPTDDLPGIYQGSSLFIYPSSFEGFGLPVLEAVQSGIPVIAAKGSCLEETGGPNSVYIDPFTTDEFSRSIQNLLDDSSLREKMSKQGILFAQNFNPENFIKKLHTIYESLQ